MFPSRIPKKSHLQCWAGQGHKTYIGSERVQYITPYATLQLQITAISHHSGSLYLRSPLLISKWPNEWFHPHMALFTRLPRRGYTLLAQTYLKRGRAVERRMKNGRAKSFFFFIFGNFVCGDVREEVGGRGLETRRWHIGDVQRIWGWGGEGFEGELFSHDGNIGMLP